MRMRMGASPEGVMARRTLGVPDGKLQLCRVLNGSWLGSTDRLLGIEDVEVLTWSSECGAVMNRAAWKQNVF